jgi:hypothetical protein
MRVVCAVLFLVGRFHRHHHNLSPHLIAARFSQQPLIYINGEVSEIAHPRARKRQMTVP